MQFRHETRHDEQYSDGQVRYGVRFAWLPVTTNVLTNGQLITIWWERYAYVERYHTWASDDRSIIYGAWLVTHIAPKRY